MFLSLLALFSRPCSQMYFPSGRGWAEGTRRKFWPCRPLIQSLRKNPCYLQERVQMPKPGLERLQELSEHRLHASNWAPWFTHIKSLIISELRKQAVDLDRILGLDPVLSFTTSVTLNDKLKVPGCFLLKNKNKTRKAVELPKKTQ